MLRSRITPCLLIQNGGLVKTVQFEKPKYVGDPINAVKIFNEKKVDELIILDIDATVKGVEPNYSLISHIAQESRMPICYGGGIKTPKQAQDIVKLGIEKVAVSSSILNELSLIESMGNVIGLQSIAVVLDVRKSFLGHYGVYTHNGKVKVKTDLFELIERLDSRGIGELVINSISNDGTMNGYDLGLASKVREATDVPLTILGGAGSSEDIVNLVNQFKVIGAAAGSLFVFKGVYKAVLINYLSEANHARVLEIAEDYEKEFINA